MFEDLDITNHETSEFIANNPNLAKHYLTLHDKYNNLRDDMQNRLEKIDVESSVTQRK